MPTKIVEMKERKTKAKTTTAKRTIKPKDPDTGKMIGLKVCLKCGITKKINDYYTNRDWIEQLNRDGWCKECVNKMATKDNVKEYFWYNNREWNDRIWEAAEKKAKSLASTNMMYQRLDEVRRNEILIRLTCQQVPSVMATYYSFVDNTKNGERWLMMYITFIVPLPMSQTMFVPVKAYRLLAMAA